jgi:Carboxypeptidase regulatory-like domain
MRRLLWYFCLIFTLAVPIALYAGQIYGFIVDQNGAPLKGAEITINCGGGPISGATAADGTYRINVPQQGPCKLTLPKNGGASADVVSYPNPSQYNFQFVNNRLIRR